MKSIALFCIIILFGGMIWDGYESYKKNHTINFRYTQHLLEMPPSGGTKKALDDRLKSE
jgi:hypothetical protein